MAARKPNRKQKPPSRVKYEANHPVVSARLTRELYDRLMAVTEMAALSVPEVIEVGLDTIEDGPDRSYDEGFEDG